MCPCVKIVATAHCGTLISVTYTDRIALADLKTQNIFLSKGGIVKLGDLGIAKVVESTLEQCKSFVGTPYYMYVPPTACAQLRHVPVEAMDHASCRGHAQ